MEPTDSNRMVMVEEGKDNWIVVAVEDHSTYNFAIVLALLSTMGSTIATRTSWSSPLSLLIKVSVYPQHLITDLRFSVADYSVELLVDTRN